MIESLDPAVLDRAREAALRALERRRRTRRELERRLAEKDFSPELIRETLDRLERVGLVDDLEYARAFLREKLGHRAVGARLVRGQLLARGVPPATVDQALADLGGPGSGPASGDDSPRTEADRARKALVQIRRRYEKLDPRVRRQRLLAALVRRGFDYDVAGDVIAEVDAS